MNRSSLLVLAALVAASTTQPAFARAPDGLPFLVDTTASPIPSCNRQVSPAAAWGGSTCLVVWTDSRSGSGGEDIYCARVTPQGAVLDARPVPVCTAPGQQLHTDVAFDGTNWLVVWEDERTGRYPFICGTRVSPTGAVLDPGGFVIAESEGDFAPCVAFGGGIYLVAWESYRNADWHRVFCCRVLPNGTVLDPDGIELTPLEWEDCESPAVTYGNASFLAVCTRSLVGGEPLDIWGRRVTPAGMPLDSTGIELCSAAGGQFDPTVTFGADQYLVAWSDFRFGGYQVYASRVTSTGEVLDPDGIALPGGTGMAVRPVTAFDGESYFAVFCDLDANNNAQVLGDVVTPDGSVIDSGVVVDTTRGYFSSTLVIDGANSLLAWSKLTGSTGGRTYDAERIWAMTDPRIGVTESRKPAASRPTPAATIIRGVLHFPVSSFGIGCAPVGTARHSSLVDAAGRRLLDLSPGPNDVSRLPPGVYFVRSTIDNRRSTMAKVVLAK